MDVLYEKPRSSTHLFFLDIYNILLWRTAWAHKKIVSRLIITVEIGVFLLLLSFFWWVISPQATITITPDAQLRPVTYKYLIYPVVDGITYDSSYTSPLSLWYEKITVDYSTTLSIDVANITYETQPAKWTVSIINTLPEEYSLIAWTQLITDQWIIYRTDVGVNIPAWSTENPTSQSVSITWEEFNAYGVRQWEESNSIWWTRLWVRNLSESMVMQAIWAQVDTSLEWWSVIANWVVSEADIEQLKENLIETMDSDKKQYLNKATQDDTKNIILPFDEFIEFIPERFTTDAESGDALIQLEWAVEWKLIYHQIPKTSLISNISDYVQERPLPGNTLLTYDMWSLRIYDLIQTPTTGQYYMPTRLNTVWWYDFENDQNILTSEIIDRIKWLSLTDAEKVILSYSQILDIDISMSPPRYDTLPNTEERIRFKLLVDDV